LIRSGALFAAGALLASASLADAQPRRSTRGFLSANPSAVVKAELAFARLAQEKGQWTAFRETADKDAVMFAPEAVNAQAWLRKRADPPRAVAWQPYRIFVSRDGGYAASTGPWTQPDGGSGTFTTIWRRQRDGSFKWLLDFGSDTHVPPRDDPIIEGKVADCPARGAGHGPGPGARPLMDGGDRGKRSRPDKQEPVRIAIPPPPSGEGQSDDGSLRWRWTSGATERVFEVSMHRQGADEPILRETAPVAAR